MCQLFFFGKNTFFQSEKREIFSLGKTHANTRKYTQTHANTHKYLFFYLPIAVYVVLKVVFFRNLPAYPRLGENLWGLPSQLCPIHLFYCLFPIPFLYIVFLLLFSFSFNKTKHVLIFVSKIIKTKQN